MDLQAGSRSHVPGLVVCGGCVLDDARVGKQGLSFGFQFVEEVVVLGLIVTGTPVVEVAVDAVLHFDDHLLYAAHRKHFANIENYHHKGETSGGLF
jgi:hypothetical protein